VADRRVVPAKPGNAGGGKGPDFGHVVEGHKGRRVAQAYHLQVTKPRCSGSCLISRRSPCDVGLGVTSVGEPDAGDPHVRFEVAGAGNAIRGAGLRSRAKATEKPPDPKVGAPVLDPTCGAYAPGPFGQPSAALQVRKHLNVRAPSKAWRFLQGASPCGVRFSPPPLPSVASMAGSSLWLANKIDEAYTGNHVGHKGIRTSLNVWYSLVTLGVAKRRWRRR